jgi:acetyltransferase-like isoleucine patch superfamily enzyme
MIKFYYLIGLALKRFRYIIFSVCNRTLYFRFSFLGKKIKFEGILRVDQWGRDIRIEDSCLIGKSCNFYASKNGSISIGKRVLINDFCYIGSHSSVSIGDDVMIAEMVGIRDFDHSYSLTNLPINAQGLNSAPVNIESNVWIGRLCTITKGVTIGTGSVIGANSVVTKDIPPYVVAAGQPAKIIKHIGPRHSSI